MYKTTKDHSILKDLGFSLLEEGKIIKIKACGYSMYPSIKPGSIIFIEPLSENEKPVPGEIISRKRGQGLVVHRLIRIIRNNDQLSFVTRGDSCIREDLPVSQDQIVGRVIKITDNKGRLSEGPQLIRKPHYIYNRIRVRIILTIKKTLNILFRLTVKTNES